MNNIVRFESATRALNAAGMLLVCHERIRHFCDLAVKLATAPASPAERADAAAAVHRYFTVALPLHVADEEESLGPRLSTHADALAVMATQHRELEQQLAALVPLWQALARGEEADLGAARTQAEALRRLFAWHLAEEEDRLLPAARELPPESLAAIAAEMRARRQGDRG